MIWQDIQPDGSPDGVIGRRTPQAVASVQLMERAEERLWDSLMQRRDPWGAGAAMVAGRLGLTPELAHDGVAALEGVYARVEAADDPRRFRLADASQRTAGTPAALFRRVGSEPEEDDVLALALTEGAKRLWRLTCETWFLGDWAPDASGTLQIRQDAHAWFGSLIKAAAYGRRAQREGELAAQDCLDAAQRQTGLGSFVEAMALPRDDPRRAAYVDGLRRSQAAKDAARGRWTLAATPPAGVLVIDPAAIPWTRAQALAGVEWVEILDAPADGPLGRALTKLQPRFNTARGVRLTGTEARQPERRRRAA